MRRLNHTIIKNSTTSAQDGFMMLMITMIMTMKIAMVKNSDDNNDEESDTRNFYDDDDEELDGIRFHGVRKTFERVHDHRRYTSKYRVAAHSI